MKTIVFLLLIALSVGIDSCSGSQPGNIQDTAGINDSSSLNTPVVDTFTRGKIIEQVFCKADATQSYALYIPSDTTKQVLPIIFFFDPHGKGALPVKKYSELADTFHFILVGSNNLKNGNDWPTAEKIWQTIFDDAKQRLQFNHGRIYTCGFSGGAKVASYIALNHTEIKGVIAGGAGLPDGTSAGNYSFSFTALAGEGDMNMTDLININNDFDKTQTVHRIIFFHGIHEWAPESTMAVAFAGLQFDAMKNKIFPQDNIAINRYVTESKKRLSKDEVENDLINAERECKLSAQMLEGLSGEAASFREKNSYLINNPEYKIEIQQQQQLLATEENMKAIYMNQFQQGDMNYWTKTISNLQAKAKSKTAEGAMYQRLVAYLSLAFYSISTRLINNNQNNDAQHFVALYKLDDPTNSEAWYMSAILNARSNNSQATESDLFKAAENGFTDKERLMQQPEFQNLSPHINFTKIESAMNMNK